MLKNLIFIVLGLTVIYFAVDLIFFRKKIRRLDYRNKLINILIFVAILLAFILVIKEMTLYLFAQIFLLNIVDLCVLSLATTGIVLIFKTSVTTNFAQGTMATFGAFAAAKYLMSMMENTTMPTSTKLFLAMLVAAFTSFLIGLFIDVAIIRRGRYVNAVGKQMITMGLVLVLFGIIPLVFGTIPMSIEAFSYDVKIFNVGETMLILPTHNYYVLLITLGILGTLFLALRFTKWGLGVRATASNEIVASMMGVNTRLITAMSWAIAGALGGVAAFVYAPVGSQISAIFMTPVQVNSFLAAVLGGFSTFGGPLVGALLINLFQSVASFINSIWASVIVYALVLILVLAKPIGLFGKKTAKKV
jgi:branched-chain amino acid transport system permease protein